MGPSTQNRACRTCERALDAAPNVAFAPDDGEGFNILLQALPVDAKLVLRTYKEKPEEQEKVIKAKFKK